MTKYGVVPALAAALALAGLGIPVLPAQTAADSPARFEVTEVMIPMRDGARLHTLIIAPEGSSRSLPVLLTRTPYGRPSRPRRP